MRKSFAALRAYVGDPGAAEQDLPTDVRLFNEAIGLPALPSSNLPHALLPHQVNVTEYKGKDLIVNKANKIGMTEALLREGAWRGTAGDCAGYLMMLGAQDHRLATENMRRLQNLFLRSDVLRPLVKGQPTKTQLELTNGTTYMTMPRRAAAIRGWARLKWVFLDEAAHYGLLDDEEFLSATTSRLSNTDGYLRICSTPRGQRGFFYRMFSMAASGQISTMAHRQWDYTAALGTLITQEFVDKERQRLGPLFPQEYECQFLAAQNAAIEKTLIEGVTTEDPASTW